MQYYLPSQLEILALVYVLMVSRWNQICASELGIPNRCFCPIWWDSTNVGKAMYILQLRFYPRYSSLLLLFSCSILQTRGADFFNKTNKTTKISSTKYHYLHKGLLLRYNFLNIAYSRPVISQCYSLHLHSIPIYHAVEQIEEILHVFVRQIILFNLSMYSKFFFL